MNSGKVLLGVLAGAAAGAIAGILFAPEKGSKTRRRFLDKSEDYADGLMEKFDDFFDTLNKKYQNTILEIETIASKSKSKYDAALKEVDGIVAKNKG